MKQSAPFYAASIRAELASYEEMDEVARRLKASLPESFRGDRCVFCGTTARAPAALKAKQ